jgi:phosphoadenosine phosphosulfate reductase
MKIDITFEQALAKASPSLREKMIKTVGLLRKAEKLALKYDADNGYWLAFSCGKDSQCLYHMTQLACVKFKAHFSPTSCDPPQAIRFCKTKYPEVEIIPPKTSIYKAAVEMACLPMMRVRYCCALFKEGHGSGRVTLTGVRKSESIKRSKRHEVEVSNHKFSGDLDDFTAYSEKRIKKILKHVNQDQFGEAKETEIRCISGKDKIIVNPIIDWTESDVWEFLNNVVEVPHCELYDPPYNKKRIGCILCPMSSYKNKLQDCEDYPHIKAKWLKVIKLIRGGRIRLEGVWGLNIPTTYGGGGFPEWASQYTRNQTERNRMNKRMERIIPFAIAPTWG